jgi:hypothetical protein
VTKSTKADQVRAWLNGSDLNSREIAEAVECHQGFVLAIKQRMLHPERERKRNRDRNAARWQNPECRKKAASWNSRRRKRAIEDTHVNG